ncbi:hypothetical protein [Halopseudomonas pertucinogena]|uniref:DUF892 family protein n=1 Tax=Halopseudomonas pertucinogena TaxID=86175 RepID=A0ABQ2CS77_9GAMM|nr:hypothetical protein [Halopseudomonas pertucinogena]GGJ08079.1 hypothetical protein GCM10009083_26270 [Halopseudomonas pertucinogena]
MQTETYDYLLQWTSELHQTIADKLEQAMGPDTDQRSRWLMEYIASHERELAATVERYRAQAGEAESRTWLYEHVGEDVPPNSRWELSFEGDDAEQIKAKVFELHNQLIEVFTSMKGRAPIPAAVELMTNMLNLEEGATRRLAEQAGRLNEL